MVCGFKILKMTFSIILKSQLEGAKRLDAEQIKNVLIPIISADKQKIISDLVKKSFDARKKSKELLDEAKRKVEEIIGNN